MPSVGTRTKQSTRQEHVDTRSESASHSADLGMTKRVVASVTFGGGSLSASNGTFANFGVGDDILVEGTSKSNGRYHVNAIDGVNHAFLTVDEGTPTEGPVANTVVRTV